ncbi:AI-2E family transporter [Amycolatopsis sp. FDAARGOS 1241]|nr:AI-2E family transporter [Amycolatopsis sp. FDAARGOS 1241]
MGYVAVKLAAVLVPVAMALLLAALLAPTVSWLVRKKVPRGLATAVVLVGGLRLSPKTGHRFHATRARL